MIHKIEAPKEENRLREGDKFTISGHGENKSGDLVIRKTDSNNPPPFWGRNQRTHKRNKAIKLMQFTAVRP